VTSWLGTGKSLTFFYTVWTPSKAGMLERTVKLATAWSEANSSRHKRNITTSTAEGRPATMRMPEIVETSQQQY
jgi:hypothetical protein